MREIKFRAWNGKEMIKIGVLDIDNGMAIDYYNWYDHYAGEYVRYAGDESSQLMQYIGLKNKNGKEIYQDDLLRIKGKMGDNGEYAYDCIYKVSLVTYSGVRLSFIKLFQEEPDSLLNSYPINQNLDFEYGLCVDYRNDKFQNLALSDLFTTYANNKQGQTNHYTNDIEIIGNIHENPELL